MNNDTNQIEKPSAKTIKSAVARLGKLEWEDYLSRRVEEAQGLDIPRSELDALVKRERGEKRGDDKAGRKLTLRDIEPWDEEVDGATLLDEIATTYRRYVVMSKYDADAATLWTIHSHAIDAAHFTARLFITSPDKRCGKSRLLQIIGRVVRRPVRTSNVSVASFFRIIEAIQPTLLVDEADSFTKDNDELRGVINGGYERGNPILRTVPVGDTFEVREFPTWAAVVIAGIGKLASTIEDRSIILRLERKRRDEDVLRLRMDRTPDLDGLARMAARWASDNLPALRDADPDMPSALNDRAADIWRALIAIADVVGGDWSQRARHAAVAISGDHASDDQSSAVQLLSDLRDFTNEQSGHGFRTEDILCRLHALDDRPWPYWGRSRRPINAKQLSDILRPYRVRPGTIRFREQPAKGYKRSDLESAFSRYLPPAPVTPLQPIENKHESDISTRYNGEDVTPGKSPKPLEFLPCNGVTSGKAETEAGDVARPQRQSLGPQLLPPGPPSGRCNGPR